jgi:hypothetical protein
VGARDLGLVGHPPLCFPPSKRRSAALQPHSIMIWRP